MLDHARRKVLRPQFDAIAPPVERADPDFACTRNAPADVGNAQAALPVLDHLAADNRNLRVDDGNRFGRLVIVRRIEAGDEQPHVLVHLWSRQPHPVILRHRFQHIVDELLYERALDVGFLDEARFRTQDRVAHARDLQDGHNLNYR